MSVSIAIVIPTRNRPREAMNAVKALVAEDAPLEIFVCDNSASPRALRDFCRRYPGVTYLRPARELAMGTNWDWGLREAMTRSGASHFSVHYDRKLSKPGAWSALAALAAARPDTVHSFPVDHIGHVPPPLRLWQPPWTGKLFRVTAERLSCLIASGATTDIAHALPILSNCLVPRRILDTLCARFGSVCESTGPDSAFLCRFLSLGEPYLHYDRPLGILYASRRSNGLGYLRGRGGDYRDFVKLLGGDSGLEAAPLPGVALGNNMLYHEYEVVRRETGDRLPPLEMPGILEDLARGLRWTADPALATELKALLRAEGWDGEEPGPMLRRKARAALYLWCLSWWIRWRGETSATITGFAFRHDRQALKWALRYPRPRQRGAEHLALLEASDVALGT